MNHSWEKMRVRRFVRLGEEMSEVPLDPKNAIDHRYWKLYFKASVSFICKCYSLRALQGIIDMHFFFCRIQNKLRHMKQNHQNRITTI